MYIHPINRIWIRSYVCLRKDVHIASTSQKHSDSHIYIATISARTVAWQCFFNYSCIYIGYI